MPKKRNKRAGLGHRKKNNAPGRSFIRKSNHGMQILYKKDCKIISYYNILAVNPEKIDGENKDDKKIFKND